jgi:hypothetical protein
MNLNSVQRHTDKRCELFRRSWKNSVKIELEIASEKQDDVNRMKMNCRFFENVVRSWKKNGIVDTMEYVIRYSLLRSH